MAPIGCPEHTYIEQCAGHVIEDERERELVTSKIEAINGLAAQQEQDAQQRHESEFQNHQNKQTRNPRQAGLDLPDHRPWRSAHQSVEVFLPTLPHRTERAIHPRANKALAGTKPNAMTGPLHACGDGDIFQNVFCDSPMAVYGIVDIAANHQKLPVGSSCWRCRFIYAVVVKLLR